MTATLREWVDASMRITTVQVALAALFTYVGFLFGRVEFVTALFGIVFFTAVSSALIVQKVVLR